MLSLRSLTLSDFGPFKGEQRIDFPTDGGVCIIYGENMRGKTTLLNAIRYALFGRVMTRGGSDAPIHQIGNWETAIEQHKYGFKIVLEFDYGTSRYELTREHRPRPGVATPQTDFDYKSECFLKKDGNVLGPEQLQSELARVMPETVSRFFLFDGELLQQYEELLRNESETGRKIKDAIERILGVPVLTNARSHFSELFQDAQKLESKAAQKNQKTQTLGIHQATLLEQRDNLKKETARLQADLDALRQTRTSKEEELKKTERMKTLLLERDRLIADAEKIDQRIKEKHEKRASLLATVWKGMLAKRILAVRDAVDQEGRELRAAHNKAVIARNTAEAVETSLKLGTCDSCGQEIGEAAKERMRQRIGSVLSPEQMTALEHRLQAIDARNAALRQSEAPDGAAVVKEVQNTIDELVVQRATLRDKLEEIQDQTKNIDEAKLRQLHSEYDRTIVDIGLLEQGIQKQNDKIKEIDANLEKIEAEIAKYAGADLQKERNRKDLCAKLRDLMNAGVAIYREQLRAKVEKDATVLLLKLTSEPEYSGLRINEGYGLKIVHEDGSEIPVRSAGAEHIVALSLMGALQHNAPLRGPIVMDSPFGRIDETHTKKVLQALPDMADQVLLLVYESEVGRTQARNELKANLRREYQITRRSARHSRLEPVVS